MRTEDETHGAILEPTQLFIAIAVAAFFSEFIDASLGMGYGTTLTPVLLIAGYEPLVIVPAILLSQGITSLMAAYAHHNVGNVNFNRGGRELKIALVLGFCSLAGVMASIYVAISLDPQIVTIYIGAIIMTMGLLLLMSKGSKRRFSWGRIVGIGTWAAFNKGISGGGYGPLITGGQMLAGVKPKKSVAITSLSEGIISIAGIVGYLAVGIALSEELLIPLLVGASLAVPFSALAVKKVDERNLFNYIGVATFILGIITLMKVFGAI
ncbi:MAG: sulfite exporter TauE/SafE family protein [Candidatus Thermoplasmatota archaeon]|nr:sulfite exporter TauE/SafE family protein [Candidatus Thermoplasmatota archaeon]